MSRFFELLTETIGWFRIVMSPTLAGAIIGFVAYLWNPVGIGIFLGWGIAALGLLAGIIWATRIWKKQGTVRFLSRIIATPELDYDETKVKEDPEKS